jgi:antitoxin VapB
MEAIAMKNGKDFQTLRIPKELCIDDDKVYIKKVGNALYLIPFHKPWSF